MIGRIFQAIFDGVIHVIASFLAAILEHPKVKKATSDAIVSGMTEFMRQPDLDEHLLVMNERISKTQTEFARKSGEDFPQMVSHFLRGMLSPKRERSITERSNSNVSTSAAGVEQSAMMSTEVHKSMSTSALLNEDKVSSGRRDSSQSPIPQGCQTPTLTRTYSKESAEEEQPQSSSFIGLRRRSTSTGNL